jgi:hypothetical protein
MTEAAPDDLQALFVRWDAGYYLHIVKEGYSADGDERAFFPLYPGVVYVVHKTLRLPVLWSGFIVSGLAFVVAGLFMYQWIRIDYTHEQTLLTTVLMYVFPMAFFFVAFHGEPLLLLTSIASMYYARRGNFVASGIAIALAGATRPPAFLLSIPYLIEAWQQRRSAGFKWSRVIAGACIAPIGWLAYWLFLVQTNEGASLLNAYGSIEEDKWQVYWAWPWEVLLDGLRAAVLGLNITSDWFSRILVWQDLLYALLSLILSIWSLSHIRLSTAVFMLASTLFFWTVHGPYGYAFWSTPRRVATLFPVYLTLALLLERLPVRYRWLIIGTSTMMLGLLSAWFTTGRWVA